MADGIRVSVEEHPQATGPAEVKEKNRDFLELARRRFRTIAAAESELRTEQYEDLKFWTSDQWPENVKTSRENDGRPCHTVNRLPQFLRQVTNVQRQQRPAIEIDPVGDEGDVKTAEVIQGTVRHIETISDADVAYSKGGEDQAALGRGYWRIVTDYVNDDTFDQEPRIKRIRNQFSVYFDAASNEADASDIRHAFIIEDVPTEEFKERFGDAAMSSLSDMESQGDFKKDWMPEGAVRIAEYFYVETTKTKKLLVRRPDGNTETISEEQYKELLEEDASIDGTGVAQLEVVKEREVTSRQVKWCLISGAEILEGNDAKTEGQDFPCKYIPIVRVTGQEQEIDGKLDYRGMIRDARSPQEMYNYWVSAETEMIALAPRSPYIGAFGQFEGHEAKWGEANNRNFPYLEYNPVDALGNAVGAPQRQQYDAPVQSIVIATQQADMDLKSVMGFENPSLGMLSPNERSGKAIQALQKQGEMGSSHYLDNLARAIRFTGRILLDMIPRLYDAPRLIRVLGRDEKPKKAVVFASQQGGQDGQGISQEDVQSMFAEAMEGIEGVFDLSVGRYDVSVSVGPSFESLREEAVDSMTKLMESVPDMAPVIADLMVENMNWPKKQQVSERLKQWAIKQGVLPPEEGMDDIGPVAQAQIQALTEQLEQAQQAMQEMQNAIETERTKAQQVHAMKREELESKERIEAAKAEVELVIAKAKIASDQAKQANDQANTHAKLVADANTSQMQDQTKRMDALIRLLSAKMSSENKPSPESKSTSS